MATTYFRRIAYKGRSGDGMAAQRVAYITRQGAYSPAEARVRHQGLQQGTERERDDLVAWTSENLPSWAGKATTFFSAAERYTSPHQIAYEEWRFSLPRELSRVQQMDAARDFLRHSFGETHPYVWAFHCPRAADGGEQPHVHVLWSARTLDGHARSPEQFFRRYNRAHPERGGAEKSPALIHMGAVKASRVLYTDVMNMHLERAGKVERLHPDRLADRGIDRTPEPVIEPSHSNKLKHYGEVTARMQEVLDHRQARQARVIPERNNARAYWEHRKAELGMTRDMASEVKLRLLTDARSHRVSHAPAHRTPARQRVEQFRAAERELVVSIQGLEQHLSSLQRERRLEQAREQRKAPREWKAELAAERVLAAGVKHGLPRDPQAEQMVAKLERTTRTQDLSRKLRGLAQSLRGEEAQQGAALRVKLYDHEKDETQGLSY